MTLEEKIAKNKEILASCILKKENLEKQISVLSRKIQNQENALMNRNKNS